MFTDSEKAIIREAFSILQRECYKLAAMNGFWDHPFKEQSIRFLSEEPNLSAEVRQFIEAAGNLPARNKGEQIALIHSELSEMLEGNRKPSFDQHCPEFTSEEVELADTFIRGFDYAGGWQLDLANALIAKFEFNTLRPRKHGKVF